MADALGILQYMDQIKQTEEAKKKEAERKARIDKGLKAINDIFEGKPIMGKRQKAIDFSGLSEKTPVGGYSVKARKKTGKAAAPAAAPKYDKFGFDLPAPDAAAAGPAGGGGVIETIEGYDLVDAKGKVVASGKTLNDLKKFKATQTETYDTKKRKGGVGKDLYDKYRKAQQDYYFPALGKQYENAKRDLTFKHADAGTTVSSMTGDNLADIEGQNVENTANINSQIEDSVGALTRQVAQDKNALVNQLYATENPTMAANAATSKIASINTQQPALNPIGEFFKLAAIGGGSALQAANNPYAGVGPYKGINTSSGRIIT